MTAINAPISQRFRIPLALFVITVLTRLPFTSKFFYNLDSGQFVLALDHYDILLNTPHPPGYFLYVMIGRLAKMVIGESNTALIALSILFSGLVVVMLYYLGREVFDKETGLAGAVIAITSPLLWFHGEVALSYMTEAFMSVLAAYLCYKMLMGDRRFYWPAAVALGLAGGFRQNTMVFLVPLWLYSMKGIGPKRITISLVVSGITVLAWFAPMVYLTGGYDAYSKLLTCQWTTTVWNGIHVLIYGYGMVYFIMCGLGVAVAPLLATAYFAMRRKIRFNASRTTVLFFMLWLLPSFLFHITIYNYPYAPGYSLMTLVGLFLLAGRAMVIFVRQFAAGSPSFPSGRVIAVFVIFVAAVNSMIFLFYHFPYSARGIREHDKLVSDYLEAVKNNFSPADTEVIGSNNFILSYRHVMYYLPEYKVYNDYPKLSSSEEGRRLFWGQHKTTHRAPCVSISPATRHIVDFFNYEPDKLAGLPPGARIISIPGGNVLVHFENREDLYKDKRVAPLLDPEQGGAWALFFD